MFTGTRRGEALGLTGLVTAPRSRRGSTRIQTKTTSRARSRLNDHSDAVLARRGRRHGVGVRQSDWNRYRSAWDAAVKRAKLTNLRFHDLRILASWLCRRAGRSRRSRKRRPQDADHDAAIRST